MVTLPLEGKEILITRGEQEAEGMSELVKQYGGIPHIVPLLAFRFYEDHKQTDYINQLPEYEWIIFTSKNTVRFFVSLLKEKEVTFSTMKCKIGAVGDKTGELLRSFGYTPDFIPDSFTAEDFAEQFLNEGKRPKKVLIPKGNLARNILASSLREYGISCDEWILYENYFPQKNQEKLKQLLLINELDAVTFTSSSAIHHFIKTVEKNNLKRIIEHPIYACIGPVAKETAESYGLKVEIVPERYTMEDLVEALAQYFHAH
ncbi:uroporphyrinogen-III synthase [Bacillus pakistanensis]|uniref:Uroporphyrinogen-III synthase n=1 Tax=Rossellomorea pakistanensis TaxID=992288 RepID=A0ABS2NAH6_9BACI|nr:uroporphyrinogen-III synthase [Bacillus pakistanensis]MBM7584856.1 uroporphyrinogen-III synthase [Bacillus pakistanensis]